MADHYYFNLSSAACDGMVVSWNENGTPETWTASGGETVTPTFTAGTSPVDITDVSVDCSGCPHKPQYVEFDQ